MAGRRILYKRIEDERGKDIRSILLEEMERTGSLAEVAATLGIRYHTAYDWVRRNGLRITTHNTLRPTVAPGDDAGEEE